MILNSLPKIRKRSIEKTKTKQLKILKMKLNGLV